jgi:NADH-quinone oxidoreductase subunit C
MLLFNKLKYFFWLIPSLLCKFNCSHSQPILTVYIPLNVLRYLSLFIKYHSVLLFNLNCDIIGFDLLHSDFRFTSVYQFLSLTYNSRINVRVSLSEKSFLHTISDIFSSADWAEREVWDLFGVYFLGHSDLRRILTDYSFKGHPLRKDFPVTGFFESFYDDFQKVVVYEKVELSQESKVYSFSSPWL